MATTHTISTADLARSFEEAYCTAAGDRARIRWDDGRANPHLVSWLDRCAADCVRPGSRVAVVGCGLGDDVRLLGRRGYDVCGFDVSPTAIEWAKSVDPDWSSAFTVADLFALPTRWRHRFDFVVEVHTVQSLPPPTRFDSFAAITSLLHPHGQLLMICRGAERPQTLDEGPPWALTADELRALAAESGLEAPDGIEVFVDDEVPPQRRMRTLLRRAR